MGLSKSRLCAGLPDKGRHQEKQLQSHGENEAEQRQGLESRDMGRREGKILRESMGAMWIQGEQAGQEQGLVHVQVHQLCQWIHLSPPPLSAPPPVR